MRPHLSYAMVLPKVKLCGSLWAPASWTGAETQRTSETAPLSLASVVYPESSPTRYVESLAELINNAKSPFTSYQDGPTLLASTSS